MKSVGRLYASGQEGGPEEKERLAEYLRKAIADYPIAARILIANPSGEVVMGGGAFDVSPSTVNLSDRTFLKRAAAGDRGLIFDGPVKARLSSGWLLTLSRRLESGKGVFLGAVSAGIPVESLTKLFSTLDYVDGGGVALWTDSGVLVARYASEPGAGAGDATGARMLSETGATRLREHADLDHNSYESVAKVDGVARLFAYQKLKDAPYFVTVGVPKAALDQSWRQIALVLGLLWAAATSAAFWIARRQHATAVLLYEDNRLLGERVAERAAEIQAKTRALTASEQKFSDAMACAPVAMGLFTAEGRILEVNAALCDLLGYAREELLSFEVARIFAPGEKPLDRAVIQRLAAGELKTYRSLRHYTHKDGRRIAAQVDTSVARTASGEVHYFISQGQDISARLAYEDRLKMLNVDLAERVEREVRARQSAQAKLAQNQKMAALGQLAGGVAHDFNTVLQTVLLGATSIRRLPDESEQSKSIAARIEAAASRGAAITGRLLSFARRNELSLEAVDVPSVLSELAEMLRPAFAPRVHLVVETAPDLPRTSTDRHQLEAALVNLATNAADAIVGEGRIVVAAREERALDGDVRRLEPGAYVRIDVRDDGAGMDEETLSHAFEPFFTTKEVGKGTGLGLPTARAFAEQSGGALTIASRPGEGTTASLWLPVAASPDASVTPLAPARLEAGRPLRVLLVDDEQPLVDRLAQDLRDHGFVVDVAETGAEALARLDAGAIYDVVVAELAMPRMDGVALLDEARLRVPDMPAVILTGNAVVAAQRIETLAVSLVRKPVSAAALAAAIAEAVHDRPDSRAP